MKFIYIIAFLINILIIIAIDLYLWKASWCWGAGGLIGLAGFFVAFRISRDMVLAPRDYWRNSQYSIFKKKIAYGNTIAALTTVIASFVFMALDQL